MGSIGGLLGRYNAGVTVGGQRAFERQRRWSSIVNFCYGLGHHFAEDGGELVETFLECFWWLWNGHGFPYGLNRIIYWDSISLV